MIFFFFLKWSSLCTDSPLVSPSVTTSSSSSSSGGGGLAGGGGPLSQNHSYSSSPLSLFRLQEQFRQHMAATNNLVHYPAFDLPAPSSLPYLGMNVNMPPAPLGTLPCQSYYQSLSHHAQQVWNSPLLQASAAGGLSSHNSKTTSIENLRLRAKQHAASLGLDTLSNWEFHLDGKLRSACEAKFSPPSEERGGRHAQLSEEASTAAALNSR